MKKYSLILNNFSKQFFIKYKIINLLIHMQFIINARAINNL